MNTEMNWNSVSWKSPSNIALVKYWGKYGQQLPRNASLSFTLDQSYSQTTIFFRKRQGNQLLLDFQLKGKSNEAFQLRIAKYLERIVEILPSLNGLELRIETENTFPHSAGIASSASGFSAIALGLCSIAEKYEPLPHEFFQTASFLARLGSGSAARSVYGGAVLWGETNWYQQSANEYAIPVNTEIHPVFATYRDSILIVSDGIKAVSSTVGHSLMHGHDFEHARFAQADQNLKKLQVALKTGNQTEFIQVVENEALSLHAMMMTSEPWFLLMKPETLEIIHRIRYYRERKNIPIAFTLDAGPNIHLLYPEAAESEIHLFIQNELEPFCNQKQVIHDKVGSGPKEVFDPF